MIIDIHQHITYRRFPEFSKLMAHGPFNATHLVKDMDKWGIDKSIMLPLANPENMDYFGVALSQEVILESRRFPDRLIPFCNLDPRAMQNNPDANLSIILNCYRELGCVGIGEVCASLPFTDPLYKNLFHHAGECGLPVLFHLSPRKCGLYGVIDKHGLPGLEEVLREFPKTIFIGHAPAFWNEIDEDAKSSKARNGYPKGPIKNEGALWRLMETCPNLYGDFSAGSGHNALTRDPETGVRFLKKFQKKVFFGTDMFMVKKEPPMHLVMMNDLLKNKKISKALYEDITHRNFERVFPMA
ncbi:MAG: amidohydrolase family protein [Victivallales bacterium]|nr:amidohydrolase family protein [Victivallales bacterium]